MSIKESPSERGTVESPSATADVDPHGWFGGLDMYSKIMLGAFVVLFAVAYVPVAMNSSLEVFGLPWYFVVFPVGMFLYNGLYLVLTYYLDFSDDVGTVEASPSGGE